MPEFSIIVPVYNVEKYLNRCIDSVLNQSFGDFELILVDDGSTDGCPQICDGYAKNDERVHVVHKENGGPSAARNVGIDLAKGKFCWFVDGDDCISPDALERLLPYTRKSEIVNFGYSEYRDPEAPDFNKNKKRYPYTGLASKEDIRSLMNTACTKVLLPFAWRNVYLTSFIKENNLRFQPGLSIGEDSVFNMEAFLKSESIYFADEYFYGYYFRVDGLSKKRQPDFDFSVVSGIELYNKLRDENYKKLCSSPNNKYFEDAGRYIIESIYIYTFLFKLSKSTSKKSFRIFKDISSTELIKKAFGRFDINQIKTKSLEWKLFFFVKHKLYLPAYIIYRMIF